MPKIKNPLLCQLVLYAPALVFFAVILLGFFFEESMMWIWVVLMFVSGIAGLAYLFAAMIPLLAADGIFSAIRCWKRDRLWYPSRRIGADAEAALRKIRERAGEETKFAPGTDPQPVYGVKWSETSWVVCYRGIEKLLLVYRTEEFNEEEYRKIMNSVFVLQKRAFSGEAKFVLMDPKQKNQPVAHATAVVILADRAWPEAMEKIRDAVSGGLGATVPCVVDFSAGQCRFDGMGKAYLMGMTAKPEKNMAQDILRDVLFGGFLPLKDKSTMMPFPIKDLDPEMSLMDLVKIYNTHNSFNLLFFLKLRERWHCRGMKHGQFRFREKEIYYKHHKRIARMEIMKGEGPDLEVKLPYRWCLPRDNRTSKEDRTRIGNAVSRELAAKGFRVTLTEETEE